LTVVLVLSLATSDITPRTERILWGCILGVMIAGWLVGLARSRRGRAGERPSTQPGEGPGSTHVH
jgi:hypothetical protein